ncbi:MAG: hypothetical protein JXJ17_03290 [Anaerolineae bacterium]|nr:hypothetical protein [Anaerolineae bacterium]
MSEEQAQEFGCADCPLRKKAEEKPKSLMGRFWYWHIKWCPGWKAYQEHLASQES